MKRNLKQYQHQQKETTTSLLKSPDTNIPRYITLEIQLMTWDRHTHVAWFNRLTAI